MREHVIYLMGREEGKGLDILEQLIDLLKLSDIVDVDADEINEGAIKEFLITHDKNIFYKDVLSEIKELHDEDGNRYFSLVIDRGDKNIQIYINDGEIRAGSDIRNLANKEI